MSVTVVPPPTIKETGEAMGLSPATVKRHLKPGVRWRRDGQELFYLAPDRKLMAAAVNGQGSAFEVGPVRHARRQLAGVTEEMRVVLGGSRRSFAAKSG